MSRTQETEKGVLRGRNHISIVLGVVYIVSLVSLVVILAHYSVVLRDKDTQIQTLINKNA